MAKRAPASATEAGDGAGGGEVEAFLARLEHPRKEEIRAVRALVLAADPRVRESVKWNAPSFALADHFATFRLRPADAVRLVLHTGAKKKARPRAMRIDDPHGLLTWAAPDRCVLTVPGAAGAEPRDAAVAAVVRQWIAQL